MTAGISNLTIEQGAGFVLILTWTSGGTPVNLTGYTAQMMIRQDVNDPSPLVSLSTSDGSIVLGGTAGTITATILASVTSALNAGNGVYDLKVTDGNGVPKRLIQGTVTISPAVTR